MHTNVENFHMIDQIIMDFIKTHPQTLSATTQKDRARLEGIYHGKVEYMAEALALILTAERVKMMEPLLVVEQRKWVEMVPAYQVRQYLIKLKARWDAKEWEGVSDEHFHIGVRGELNELFLGGEWYDKSYEPQRKRAVRDGVVEPDESDKEWIAEELASLEAVVSPIQQLARKVGVIA